MINWNKIGLFVGGAVFGSAGFKLLGSKDAKKCYAQTTAAVLRAKDCVMTTANNIKENCDDILADAKAINEQYAAEEEASVIEDEVIEDAVSEETVEETEETSAE